MFKRFAVIALLALASATAIAIPKPSEVKAAVASGNYAKAETMLVEVIKEKPSARAHYDLGQVYTFQGKHGPALNAYRQAQALDPTLKFASSASEFTKKLATAQAMVAPPPVIVAQAPAAPPPVYSVPQIQQTAAAPPPKKDEGNGGMLLVAVILLFGIGAAIFYFVSTKREKKKVEDQATTAKREANTKLLGFSKSLEDAVLIAKTALYSDAQKRQILDRITGLQSQTRTMLAELKDGKELSAVRLSHLETNVNTILEQADRGIPTAAPTPAPTLAPVPPAMAFTPAPKKIKEQVRQPKVSPTPAPAPVERVRTVHHYHTPERWSAPTPAPAPTVVNTSNNDLLTGVLLGSVITSQPYERPRMDTPRYERDDYEDRTPAPAPYYSSPAPAPTFDSGSDSKDDYAASAPSMDSSSDSSSSDDDKY